MRRVVALGLVLAFALVAFSAYAGPVKKAPISHVTGAEDPIVKDGHVHVEIMVPCIGGAIAAHRAHGDAEEIVSTIKAEQKCREREHP